VSSFATSVGISSSGWWAAGHHPLDEAGKGLQGFAAEMFSGRTRIIGEQEREAGRAHLGGWRPPGAADVLPAAGEDGRAGVEVGGPERVGAAPGVERQVHGPPHGELHGEQRAARPGGASLRCCHRASEGILHRVAAGGRTLYGRVEPAGYRGAARSRQGREREEKKITHLPFDRRSYLEVRF